MPHSTQNYVDTAIAFCSQKCFHQCLYLPQTSHHLRIRVTYATTTNFEDVNLPVVLFCTPMGASRLLIFEFDHTAHEAGVRMIFIDR